MSELERYGYVGPYARNPNSDRRHGLPQGRYHPIVARHVRELMVRDRVRTKTALSLLAGIDKWHLGRALGGTEAWTLWDLERLGRAFDVDPPDLLRTDSLVGGEP